MEELWLLGQSARTELLQLERQPTALTDEEQIAEAQKVFSLYGKLRQVKKEWRAND